jgi:omega-6 fatty acid desaturase (delta-12 desaturase)
MKTIIENNSVSDRSWEKVIMKYNRPDLRKSIGQIVNSFVPYIVLLYLMVLSLSYSYLVTLGLAVLASGFMIRLFIIFHDCGHGSFFRSQKANNIAGIILGILTFTPYYKWHHAHKIHHATSGDLDKRGIGDVWTMTVEEYAQATAGKRFFYRAFRNPFIMLTIGPLFVIGLQNRLTKKSMSPVLKRNIYFTNLVILAVAIGMSLIIGLKAYLMIQLPVIILAHIFGIWLFYVQHQFEEVSWERSTKWDYKTASLQGSSFLKLPRVLQWFTGNIGFHHVHHLSSRIPNYNLAKCHYENEMFDSIQPLGLWPALKTFRLKLWDEASRRMVAFGRMASSVQYS